MSKLRAVLTIEEEIIEKTAVVEAFFEKADYDGENPDITTDQVDDIRAKHEELIDLNDELRAAMEVDKMFKANQLRIREAQKAGKTIPFSSQQHQPTKEQVAKQMLSLGDQFLESDAYKSKAKGRQPLNIELSDYDPKHLMKLIETTDGFAPEVIRSGRIEYTPLPAPMVDQLLPQITTQQEAIRWMLETTFDNQADGVAEGAAFPESDLVYTEQSTSIAKLATFLAVTDEQVDDVTQMRSILNQRLSTMIRQRRENQLLQGTGGTDILGFYNTPDINTQVRGTDNVADAIMKGMTKVRTIGYANPTGVVMHPNDWQSLRLMKTADGVYIWGAPSIEVAQRVWGVPVVSTTNATEGTAFLGDFSLFSQLAFRMGLTIKISDSHASMFTSGQQAIRAEERLALVVYRPTAFCAVSDLETV